MGAILKPDDFGRYLLRELLWELAQFRVTIPELTDVLPEQIEVLSYSGYDIVRVRTASMVLDAHLSWRGDIPPVVGKAADYDGETSE